jgi:hypothetical protein
VFASVAATPGERRAARPGDDIIARPDVVMDRAFTVALVYRSVRGRTTMTWSVTLRPVPAPGATTPDHTRVQLRLRLAPVRRKWLAETLGGLIDRLTIAGLAAGLKERLPAVTSTPSD